MATSASLLDLSSSSVVLPGLVPSCASGLPSSLPFASAFLFLAQSHAASLPGPGWEAEKGSKRSGPRSLAFQTSFHLEQPILLLHVNAPSKASTAWGFPSSPPCMGCRPIPILTPSRLRRPALVSHTHPIHRFFCMYLDILP